MNKICIPKNLCNHILNVSRGSNPRPDILSIEYIINKIIECLYFDGKITDKNNYEIEYIENDFYGVIVNDKELVYFTQLLGTNKKERSRNTFFSQNINKCFELASEMNINISASMNPCDLNEKFPKAESIIFDLILFNKIGVNINNSILNKINKSIDFNISLDELILWKKKISSKNEFNDSIKIFKNPNNRNLTIYGRTDGANKSTTINFLKIIGLEFKNWEINFFEINNKINLSDKEKLSKYNINIFNLDNEYNKYLSNSENLFNKSEIKRRQDLFIGKIVEKYWNTSIDINKCFCCDYSITENLIASHIHRFADIKKEYENNIISLDEANKLIVSGENGFLLCPNHDKEFEKGFIYFSLNSFSFKVSDKFLNILDYEKIKFNLKQYNFDSINYSNEFGNNVKKHLIRTNNTESNFIVNK